MITFRNHRAVLPLGLWGIPVEAGKVQLKCSMFIVSVDSWGTNMKQVKAVKPDVPSRTVAFHVFMTWEPTKPSEN